MTTDFPVGASFVATANPAQLHDEARGSVSPWPASFTLLDGGTWVYRVDLDLDAAARQQVTSAIAAHAPQANYGLPSTVLSLVTYAQQQTWTAADVSAVVRLLLRFVLRRLVRQDLG